MKAQLEEARCQAARLHRERHALAQEVRRLRAERDALLDALVRLKKEIRE